MGLSHSLLLPPVLNGIKNWSWNRVETALKNYIENDLDFGLDAQTIASFSGLSLEESKEIAQLLSRSDGGAQMYIYFLYFSAVL